MSASDSILAILEQMDELEGDLESVINELQRVDAALIHALAALHGTANWCQVKGNDRSASFLRERANEIERMARGEEEVKAIQGSQHQVGSASDKEPSP